MVEVMEAGDNEFLRLSFSIYKLFDVAVEHLIHLPILQLRWLLLIFSCSAIIIGASP